MFKNYLKIAWRNPFRDRIYSVINILSLSIGMAISLLNGIRITDDLSLAIAVIAKQLNLSAGR